jgi:hydrogenase expression/formation protein HypC
VNEFVAGEFIPLRPARVVAEPHLDCPICRDEALPARVLAVDAATNMATLSTGCGESEAALDLLDGVRVGDVILVHLGVAIARLNEGDVADE